LDIHARVQALHSISGMGGVMLQIQFIFFD